MKLNISMVLYQNNLEDVKKCINCCLNSNFVGNLYLIDNSKDNNLSILAKLNDQIKYIFNNSNYGYGKGHNIAIKESIEKGIDYHLIINPDIYFGEEVLKTLYEFMQKNKDIGVVMPKILYPDKKIQYLCKLLPTPYDLFLRRFSPFKKINEKVNEKYELRFTHYTQLMEIPVISGCFMFIRTSILKEIGGFDERFFMYLEDVDLCRRINQKARIVYFPKVEIIHNYEKGSYKNIRLLLYHVISACKYFNKWGWFLDHERRIINKRTIYLLQNNNG